METVQKFCLFICTTNVHRLRPMIYAVRVPPAVVYRPSNTFPSDKHIQPFRRDQPTVTWPFVAAQVLYLHWQMLQYSLFTRRAASAECLATIEFHKHIENWNVTPFIACSAVAQQRFEKWGCPKLSLGPWP